MENSERAMRSVDRANKTMALLVGTGMIVIIALLGYNISAMNYYTREHQEEMHEQVEATDRLLKNFVAETDRQHEEQLKYVQCVGRIPASERVDNPDTIDKCIEE